MPDYDLGRAHGKIVITSDTKGVDDADKSLQELEKISARLDKALSGTRRALINGARSFRDLNGGVVPAIKNMQTIYSVTNSYVSMMTRASRSANIFTSEIRKFSNGLSLAQAIGKQFQIPFLKGADTSKLPVLVQQIMALYSGIQLFRTAQGILANLATRFNFLGIAGAALGRSFAYLGRITGLSAVFGVMGRGATLLRGRFAALRGPIAAAAAALFGFGKNLPVVGGAIGKLGGAAALLGSRMGALPGRMNAFGGTLKTVQGALSRTLGVTESFSRKVTRLAFFTLNAKAAWTGFQKGLRLVSKVIAVGATAITGLMTATKGLGVVIAGTINALGQLSGIAAILPGVLSIAAAAAGVLKLGLQGIGDAMKALGGTDEEFTAAIEKLAPAAQNAMKALREFAPAFKEIQQAVQGELFQGLDEEIARIGGPLMDTLKGGAVDVGRAFNGAAKQVTSFLGEAQTTKDLSTIFRNTGTVVKNLGNTLKPLLGAFRDIAAVGSQAFADMTRGAGSAAQRFADFISQARQSGKIREVIDNAVQGFKDLWASAVNVVTAVRSVFAAFGVGGDGALARLRELTDKFVAVFSGADLAGDSVQEFISIMEQITDQYLATVAYAFERIEPVVAKLLPYLAETALLIDDGIRKAVDLLVPAFNALASVISGPLSHEFASLTAKAITMVILLKSFKLLGGVFAPLIAGVSALWTAISSGVKGGVTGIRTAVDAFRGVTASATVAGQRMGKFGSAIAGIGRYVPTIAKMQESFVRTERSINKFTPATAAAAKGMGALSAAGTGLKSVGSTLTNLIGGPVVAGLLALGAAIYSVVAAQKAWTKAADNTAKVSAETAAGVTALGEAFEASVGKIDAGVLDQVSTNLDTMRQGLKDTAATGTGFFADMGANLRDIGTDLANVATFKWGETFADGAGDANNAIDEVANRAKAAEKAFTELGYSAEQMQNAVATQGGFDSAIAALAQITDGGDAAAAELTAQRDAFVAISDSMGRIGEPALTVSNALAVIGDEASSASEKLDAMRSALQAMGILETTAQEAMFQVSETIRDVGAAAITAADQTQPLGNAMLNLDGTFNTQSVNAAKLREQLAQMGDSLLGVASSGGNVNEAYGQMGGTLDQLAQTFGLTREQVDALGRSVGIAPKELSIFVALQGSTQAQQELFQIAEYVQRVGGVKEIIMKAQTSEAIASMRSLGFEVEVINATTGEVKITATSEQAKAALEQLNQIKNGVVQPGTIPITVPGAPAAIGDLGAVDAAAAQVDGAQAAIDATVTGAEQAKVAIQDLGTVAQQEIPPVKVDVSQEGAQPTADAVRGAGDAAVDAGGKFGEFANGVSTAMGTAVAAAQSGAEQAAAALQGAASSAFASGSALGSGFAAGINSQVGAVAAAAQALAAAASAPLPNSPAKTGPFSGRGWTPFRGAALAEGFAAGIAGGADGVGAEAMGLAKAVQSALDGIRAQLGFTNPEPVPLAMQTGEKKYIKDDSKTDAELREANLEKIAEREAKDAEEARKKVQEDAKKAAEEAALPPAKEKTETTDTAASDRAAAKDVQEEEKKAADARMEKALQVLEEGNSSQEETAAAVGELNRQGIGTDPDAIAALNAVGGRDASDADVINGLATLDARIATEGDESRKSNLKALRDSAIERRGLKEYDPFEGASENVLDDSVGLGNDIVGLFDQFKQGLNAIKDLGALAIRGISNTNDITTAIDGVQSIANAIGGIASTVGNIVSTVGSLAAAAGAAIPGIGQVAAGIGMFTGALSSVNGIVDLAQDVFKLGGQIFGGFLSNLAGGADGALMGDVKMLLDTNDGTLKRWSADNPDDKRSTKVMDGTGNTTNTGVENLNIYQGAGVDPYRMVDEAMFSVKAASQGAYA